MGSLDDSVPNISHTATPPLPESAAALEAKELIPAGQNENSNPPAEGNMNDSEGRNSKKDLDAGLGWKDSEALQNNNRSSTEDRLDSQHSGQVQQEPQQHHHHLFRCGGSGESDAHSPAITDKLNCRKSRSVNEGSMGMRSNSIRGRLAATNPFSRTRSLSKVADISSSWMTAQALQQQFDRGQNPAKDPSNQRLKSSSRTRKIHPLHDVAKDNCPHSEVAGVPPASRSGSVNVFVTGRLGEVVGDPDDGEKQGPPDQSPIEEVALIVPTDDDPSMPVWTFRACTLGIMSTALLSFLNTYFSYRNEPIILGVTTALIVSFPLGKFMAAVLPDKMVRIPGTKYGFSLNPGEFNTKEHSLIVQFASAGASRPGGLFVISLVKIYLKGKMEFFPAFVFTLTCELIGLSIGAMLQRFLVEPAQMWWPASLVNVSLVKALHKEESRKGMSRIQFFMVCLMASFAYHVLPGYLFPTLSGISVVCYMFKHNTLAQQLGSGNRGLGLGAFTLDYATIASFLGSPLVVPSIAVFNIIVGFFLQAYIFVPVTYWRNYYKSKNFPLFSSSLYTSGGNPYNVSMILNSSSRNGNFKFEGAGYDVEGPTYFSAFYAVSTGLTFMLFSCIVAQVLLFHGGDLWRTVRSMIAKKQEDPDVHTHLMRKYPGIPAVWSFAMLLALYVISCVNVQVYKEQLQMKWWGVLLGAAVAAFLVLPVGILMATTNQLPNLAIMAQYLMGYISPGEPVTSGVFRSYSTLICGRVAFYLANFKFGHYMKLPPRATFLSQAIGTVVATLVSLLVTWWLTSTINDICDTVHLPRNTPWTCPADRVFFDQAVTWGLVGPKKLFDKGGPYNSLNYYFLPGMALPIILWLLRWAFPDAFWLTYINAPLIVRGAWPMPPSAVVNNTTWLAIALVFGVYVFTYRKRWWQRYNYVLSAAADTGTVMMALLLYYSMDEGKKRLHWWGKHDNGDHCPLASCPIAVPKPGCHGY